MLFHWHLSKGPIVFLQNKIMTLVSKGLEPFYYSSFLLMFYVGILCMKFSFCLKCASLLHLFHLPTCIRNWPEYSLSKASLFRPQSSVRGSCYSLLENPSYFSYIMESHIGISNNSRVFPFYTICFARAEAFAYFILNP
jgi:hypothetical protein